jgi:hypothetical protein
MSTQEFQKRHHSQIRTSLRKSAADFFRMDLPQATFKTQPRDRQPLHRSLDRLPSVHAWVGNENMCTALWQLMVRD